MVMYKLDMVRPRLDMEAHVFAVNVADPGNTLSGEFVEAISVERFKLKLDRVFWLIFSQGLVDGIHSSFSNHSD